MVNTRTARSAWLASSALISPGRSLSDGYSLRPSVSTTTALIRSSAYPAAIAACAARVLAYRAVPPSGTSPEMAARSCAEFAPTVPIGTCSRHGCDWPAGGVENVHRPTWSSLANMPIACRAAFFASSSLLCPPLVSSSMEPDVSSTSRTRARLRWASQPSSTLATTGEAGGFTTLNFASGSRPLAVLIAAPTNPSYPRNAKLENFSCWGLSLTNARKSAAAAFCSSEALVSTTYGLSDSSVPSFGYTATNGTWGLRPLPTSAGSPVGLPWL